MRTDVIYRVIVSPVEHFYATSNGTEIRRHHSAKRASLAVGDLPHEVVTLAEFERMSA